MATVLRVAGRGDLQRYDPGLPSDRQEFRCLYGSQRFVKWVIERLPGLGSTWNIELTPQEQFVAPMEIYASGDVLLIGYQLKPLVHLGDGVWELKTADLRLFGWFYTKDQFIAHAGDTAERIKTSGMYAGYVGDVVRYRDSLDLNSPKFVPGDDPNDVVSNFDLPK